MPPSPSPLPCLRLSPVPSPPHLCRLRPPRLLATQDWACRNVGSRVWSLCWPPPGVSRINQATMARVCAVGVPLPPNGGGAPPPSPVLTGSPAPPPPPTALSCGGGGGSLTGLGGFPHLLVQTVHKWCARLFGLCPPLPFWLRYFPIPPPPPAYRVPEARAARGVLSGFWWCGGGGPPCRACRALGAQAARGTPHPRPPPSGSGVSPPPALACHALGAHSALGGPSLPLGSALGTTARAVRPLPPCLPPGVGGALPRNLACLALGAQSAVPGGPPLSLDLTTRNVHAQSAPPPPSCSCALCACGWGRGTPSWSWAPSSGGVPVVCVQGLP